MQFGAFQLRSCGEARRKPVESELRSPPVPRAHATVERKRRGKGMRQRFLSLYLFLPPLPHQTSPVRPSLRAPKKKIGGIKWQVGKVPLFALASQTKLDLNLIFPAREKGDGTRIPKSEGGRTRRRNPSLGCGGRDRFLFSPSCLGILWFWTGQCCELRAIKNKWALRRRWNSPVSSGSVGGKGR